MKIIVAGGRDFKSTDSDIVALKELFSEHKCTEVVCGEASGADTFGKTIAIELGIPVKSFPAKWNDLETPPVKIKYNSYNKPYNALAGFNRNREMAEYADMLIAFKGGNGTKDMINQMINLNKQVITVVGGM